DRSDGRGRSEAEGAWRRGPTRGRCLDHADLDRRQNQWGDHHDRRKGRRSDQGGDLADNGLASMYPASDWSVCSGPSWISACMRSDYRTGLDRALQQEGADLIDYAGTLTDQALADAVQGLQVKLVRSLGRNELHGRA